MNIRFLFGLCVIAVVVNGCCKEGTESNNAVPTTQLAYVTIAPGDTAYLMDATMQGSSPTDTLKEGDTLIVFTDPVIKPGAKVTLSPGMLAYVKKATDAPWRGRALRDAVTTTFAFDAPPVPPPPTCTTVTVPFKTATPCSVMVGTTGYDLSVGTNVQVQVDPFWISTSGAPVRINLPPMVQILVRLPGSGSYTPAILQTPVELLYP
ncbi:MAG: hypothetical protein J5I53_09875 [Bradyrhizobiaceae bacterium]|nr:hypothetical protein [Bradyrhizobiaceae bacterium]